MIVHRYWTGPDAPLVDVRDRIRELGHDLKDWTDDTLPRTITKQIDSVGQVHPDYAHRHRANLVRLCLLYKYGGIWLDYDLCPTRNLDDLPQPWIASLQIVPTSCAMGFPKGHRFLRDVLKVALANEGHPDAKSMSVSGEQLIASMLPPRSEIHRVRLPSDSRGRVLSAGSNPPIVSV